MQTRDLNFGLPHPILPPLEFLEVLLCFGTKPSVEISKKKKKGILVFQPGPAIIKKFGLCGIYFTIDSRNIKAVEF